MHPETWRQHAVDIQRNAIKCSNDHDSIYSVYGIAIVACASKNGLVHSYAYTGTQRECINLITAGADKHIKGDITPEEFTVLCGVVLLDPLKGKDVLARLGQAWSGRSLWEKSQAQRMLAKLLLRSIHPPSAVDGSSKV